MLRRARVLLLAAAVVGLSVLSHLLAGGRGPGVVPLLVLTVLTAVGVLPFTRARLGLPRLLALLGTGQLVLHVAFERCAALGPATRSAVPGHATTADLAAAVAMLAAHAAATLGLALVLRYGDAVLWRLWAWLTGLGAVHDGAPVLVPRSAAPRTGAPVAHAAPVRGAWHGRAPPWTILAPAHSELLT